MSDKMNRRRFLSNTSAVTAGGVVGFHFFPARVFGRGGDPPSEKIVLGNIAVGGRGRGFLKPGMTAAICDVDSNHLQAAGKLIEERGGGKPALYKDYRDLLDQKDLDAVVIASPDHWHGLMTIHACEAGKDVYVEKPGTHELHEGRKMIEAAHKYKRIVQHGVQLRSSPALQEAVKLLQDGIIGKVYLSRGLVFRWRPSIGHFKNEPAPSYLNWDIWQGPAQAREFTKGLVHYNWHWHWAYGNGDVGNQGIHETDMCLWGLGLEKFPSKITAMGDRKSVV